MKKLKLLLNPFEKIAGYQALVWGCAGLIVSSVLNYCSGYHYHGLLHFGTASNPSYWIFLVEAVIVWLIPALMFLGGGLALSKSQIRPVDVLGTVAFAQLPFVLQNAAFLLPSFQRILRLDTNMTMQEMLANKTLLMDALVGSFILIFIVWVLVWMFQAFKVSCNLKSTRLGVWYAISIIGGDVICRLIIRCI